MKRTLLLCAALAFVFGFSQPSASAAQSAGQIASNFSAPYHTNAARTFRLYDFPGKILLLEFFFATCPNCIGAAPRLESDIVEYYRNRGGNAEGLPVQMINLDVHGGVPAATTTAFMNEYNLEVVVRDWAQVGFSQFSGTGTPHFVVINSVSNSASHADWQIVGIDDLGFPTLSDPQYASKAAARIAALRALIDSVKAPNLPPDLVQPEKLENGQFRFALQGQLGRTNRIEVTTDWLSWSTLTNVVNASGTVTISDPGATSSDQRYYRAVVQ